MARIRTIKPEFWTSEDLSALPEATHILAAALLNHADDEGYFNANPGLVKAACSPLREPSVSIHDSLTALSNAGYLQLGTGPDGKRYGRVMTFDEHQRVNRPTPSKIKEMDIPWEDSLNAHGGLSEDSLPERKGKERKGTGKGGSREGSRKPKAGDVSLADWIAALPKDEDAVPVGDPIFKWAGGIGVPPEWLAYAWLAFEDKYSDGKKHYTDWRDVFRKAVKGDWLKVWRMTPTGPVLTTVGEQWKKSA